MKNKSRLFLIPNTLGSEDFPTVLPTGIADRIKSTRTFLIEHPKNARQLLVGLGLKSIIDESVLLSIKEGFTNEILHELSTCFKNGLDVGIISDAGCPGIADPGNKAVELAHEMQVQVVPLSGPSSITLALMASGFNGQNFAFHGYLPKDQSERRRKIKSIEKEIYSQNQTQIFIETPYRNEHLFADLLSECQKKTKICLAINLTLSDEKIRVETVEKWRSIHPNIQKKQCIFLVYK